MTCSNTNPQPSTIGRLVSPNTTRVVGQQHRHRRQHRVMMQPTRWVSIVVPVLSLLSSLTTSRHPTWLAAGYSIQSSFLGSPGQRVTPVTVPRETTTTGWYMYDTNRDPPTPPPQFNAWTVLAQTEQWICRTLAQSSGGSSTSPSSLSGPHSASGRNHDNDTNGNNSHQSNPYSRKEVTYDCEMSACGPLIVAGIFRRLKDVRIMGQQHGRDEELRKRRIQSETRDNKYRSSYLQEEYTPRTLRKTQVVVIPAQESFTQSWPVFHRLVETLNRARRNARDYVTDDALEKTDDRLYASQEEEDDDEYDDDDDEEIGMEWAVAVNCAHLHPKFGEKTPEQVLEEMKQEDAVGEVDVNHQEYLKKRMLARQSPYPSIVIELLATPPIHIEQFPPPMEGDYGSQKKVVSEREGITAADILKLEALFGKTAHTNHPAATLTPQQEEDAFYNAIGNSIEQLTTLTPMTLAQRWIAQNDPDVIPTAAFTETDTPAVDAAYEFVFTNIAMMAEPVDDEIDSTKPAGRQTRQYMVMPHFLSSAATSFEKFSGEVESIIACLPDIAGKVSVSGFHPEHINPAKRSPLPILALQWKD